MEYRLQKKLTKHYKPNYTFKTHLTEFPSTLNLNPGVAQAARIFKFFVPIRGQVSPFIQHKSVKGDEEKIELQNESLGQKGNGVSNAVKSGLSDGSLPDNDQKTIVSEQTDDDFLKKSNESEIEKLGEPLYQAFQHPIIKVNKIQFNPKKGKGFVEKIAKKGSLKLTNKLSIV